MRTVLFVTFLALLLPALAWAPPREADLRASIGVSPAPASGQVVVITASVHNGGPDSVLDGTLAATLPDGLTLLAARPTQGRCSGTQTVTCSFGLLGRFNQACDAVASARLLVRAERAGAFPVTADVSAPTSTETVAENNHAARSVAVVAYAGPRPFGRVLLKLVSATPRKVVVRVTALGPDDARAVVVNGRRVGTLAPAEERTVTFRFARAQRHVTVEERDASASGSIDVDF